MIIDSGGQKIIGSEYCNNTADEVKIVDNQGNYQYVPANMCTNIADSQVNMLLEDARKNGEVLSDGNLNNESLISTDNPLVETTNNQNVDANNQSNSKSSVAKEQTVLPDQTVKQQKYNWFLSLLICGSAIGYILFGEKYVSK